MYGCARLGGVAVLPFVAVLAIAASCGGGDDAGGPTGGGSGGADDAGGSAATSGSRSSPDGSSPDASVSGTDRDASSGAGDPADGGQPLPDDGGTNRSDAGPLGDHDASTANDAGSNPPSSECAEDCDDGIDCTADECVNEVCTHAVDAEVCDPGEACDVRGPGCATTTACGNTADCADSDPCTTRVRCNTSLASCEWDILDGDADGHPPQGCGGDDPDDGNTNVRPGATDLCDGEDNDGDGDTDEEPQASASCISGTCPGCSIGCQRYSDVAQLHAPAEALYPGASFFDFVHAVCPTLGPGIPNVCPITSGNDYFSSDCDACLTALAECGEPCPCSGTPDDGCHACLCDLNCVEPFEACSGIDHPAACN